MIHSPSQRPDDAFHLQCEEEGGEAADVNAALYGNHVDLQVVVAHEHIDDGLFFRRKVGEETALNALLLGRSIGEDVLDVVLVL